MTPKIIMNLALIAGFGFAAPSLAQDVDEGEILYQDHCSDCHGSDVDGKGPLANAMGDGYALCGKQGASITTQ